MKVLRSLLMVAVAMQALGTIAKADSVTLTLDPANGALTGPAGSIVGWGFTLNSGSDFAIVSSSDFCVGVISSPCSNSFGTYTDFTLAQFIVSGPASVSETFDNTLQTGLGSFLINPGSTGTIVGEIVLTYDLFDVDPNSLNFDPTADAISYGNYATAAASVTVGKSGTGGGGTGGGGTTSAPEPGVAILLAAGFGLLLALRRQAN
jgi:hypothetical protein